MTTLYKSTNDYLEVRGDYVLSKIAMIGDPGAEDESWEAIVEAEVLGHRDATVYMETGEPIDCSPFFADVPELLRGWIHGWNVAMETREMEECSMCNDSWCDPCPIHG